jgi:ATP-dependent RNA helicase RhlE
VFPVKKHLKIDLLEDILHKIQSHSVLVFTRTKFGAERVARTLVERGYKAASLQGNLTQSRRQAALDAFRNGSINVLVATDIAARGIDVSNISHVINYDMPDCADAYIHRIGRTGRIGNSGEAFTLITDEDMPMVRTLERLLRAPLERRNMESFNYDAPLLPVQKSHQKDGIFGIGPITPSRPPSNSVQYRRAKRVQRQSPNRRNAPGHFVTAGYSQK